MAESLGSIICYSIFIILPIKGRVSPDIELYFRFWKIKLVISAGPLMVFAFFLLHSY
jgi:hypothetical protein